LSELLSRVDANRLRFAPGSDFLYSNVGYLFVRQLIERVAGATLNTILCERVLQPLGIKGVSIAETSADLAGVEMCTAGGYHPGWVYHGLLVGPLREPAVLLDRLLGGTLLPPELIEQMLNGHSISAHMLQRPWQDPAYGLGLMCGKVPQDAFIAVLRNSRSGLGKDCIGKRIRAAMITYTANKVASGTDNVAYDVDYPTTCQHCGNTTVAATITISLDPGLEQSPSWSSPRLRR
jgi:CubicO group peptidase (beta-lactamase class C family)